MANGATTKGFGITIGGALVIVGIVIAIFWSLIIGIIVAVVGLVAFGDSYVVAGTNRRRTARNSDSRAESAR